MTTAPSSTVETARDYYNSDDADRFYAAIWGGEDIHVGIYREPGESIKVASRRTVEHLAKRLSRLEAGARVLDLGSGYGGAARHLAETRDCQVVALNLSEVENRRARELNRQRGLADRIEVIDGNFETLPFSEGSFDVVWSQDAILHSGDRMRVIREIARVLSPGDELVFTDPMQSDDCPADVLQPILDRIHLDSLASPGFYRAAAAEAGLVEVSFEDLTENLITHYSRVLEETEKNAEDLAETISTEYLAGMRAGLGRWIEGGKAGHLTWGIFHFRRPD